jgi:hypothetical protein
MRGNIVEGGCAALSNNWQTAAPSSGSLEIRLLQPIKIEMRRGSTAIWRDDFDPHLARGKLSRIELEFHLGPCQALPTAAAEGLT